MSNHVPRILLTLLVLATAWLAFVLARPAPAPPMSQPFLTDAMLEKQVRHLELDSVNVDEAMAALSQQTGVRLEVDWPSFEEQN